MHIFVQFGLEHILQWPKLKKEYLKNGIVQIPFLLRILWLICWVNKNCFSIIYRANFAVYHVYPHNVFISITALYISFTTLQVICTCHHCRDLCLRQIKQYLKKYYNLFNLLNGTGVTKHDTQTFMFTDFSRIIGLTGNTCVMFHSNFSFLSMDAIKCGYLSSQA